MLCKNKKKPSYHVVVSSHNNLEIPKIFFEATKLFVFIFLYPDLPFISVCQIFFFSFKQVILIHVFIHSELVLDIFFRC